MFFDEPLIRRLEAQNRWFYAGLVPTPDAYLDLGDTFAFFAGEGSPHTLASGRFTSEQLEEIQAFYQDRATYWQALFSPFSGNDALQRVLNLGGTVEGWENIYYRPTSVPLPPFEGTPELVVREATPKEIPIWADQCTFGYFGELASPAAREFYGLMLRADNFRRFLALWEGEPVAVASLTVGLGVGYLGDMRTLPDFRGRGIQTALIYHRLAAAESEADLVLVGTAPGNASYRNVARMGFQVAYSQLSLRVPVPPAM
jgi:GNAT superfamily N-acetyltransferase